MHTKVNIYSIGHILHIKTNHSLTMPTVTNVLRASTMLRSANAKTTANPTVPNICQVLSSFSNYFPTRFPQTRGTLFPKRAIKGAADRPTCYASPENKDKSTQNKTPKSKRGHSQYTENSYRTQNIETEMTEENECVGSEDPTASDPTLKEWSAHEKETEIESLRTELDRIRRRHKAKKTCLHHMFTLISFLTGSTAFLMWMGQVASLYYWGVDPLQGLLRCYVVLACFTIVLNELSVTQFLRESRILRAWITRGIIYSFVGVLGLAENDTTSADMDHINAPGHDQAMKFINVVACTMTAMGALYYVMGCLCLQLVYNRVMADYERRSNEGELDQKGYKEASLA